MSAIKRIELWAWERQIGSVVEEGNRLVLEMIAGNSHFSPLQFDAQNIVTSIDNVYGIGLIGDAIPGSYGMDYLGHYFQDEFGRKPSVAEILAFIGSHGLGAIEFRPPSSTGDVSTELVATLEELKTQSRRVYEGEHQVELSKLIAVSNSAIGGARTKAIVGFNPETNMIHIGQKNSKSPDGFRKCIVKFNAKKEKEIDQYNIEIKAEYLYCKLAKALGIKMSESWLIEENGICHFATERFDITQQGERLHLHSFAGLIGSDAASFATSYDALFRVSNTIAVSEQDKEQLLKTMIFNLIFGNKDDHARNFSFLMDKRGIWKVAPAYDLTFSVHSYGANKHQLKINRGFADSAKIKDIDTTANIIGIKNSKEVLEHFIDFKHAYMHVFAEELGIEAFAKGVISATAAMDKKMGGSK
ncbi:MAG: HipA domain-containing protein [Sulfuricurvum sp.]|nr:HipA domain-containing protein [Sulfuricurvum sp.]